MNTFAEMLEVPFWTLYFQVVVFYLGACWGSYLNVCIYRIPLDMSTVAPRSHCPHCKQLIPGYRNLPIFTWLIQRGRGHCCGKPISPRYLLVEILIGVLFLLVWNQYGLDARTPVYWLLVFGLMLGTFVDFEHMIIPDRVTWGGIVAGLALSPLVPALHGAETAAEALRASATGAVVGFGLLWAVSAIGKLIFRKDAMGFGDVKLMGAIGAFLGWEAVLFTVMVSSLLGSIVGLSFIALRHKEWQSRIPYGPYLAFAAVIWFLWGHAWWASYIAYVTGADLAPAEALYPGY